jgi:hypothetical protein
MKIDGVIYPTVEHYFQSMKFEGTGYDEYIRNLRYPSETAREGKRRDLPLRPDWEEVKEDIMYKALKVKFNNYTLQKKLLETGNKELVEDSPYDSYWGVGRNGTGKNRLGILLMKLREELK